MRPWAQIAAAPGLRGLAGALVTGLFCIVLAYPNILFENETLVASANFHPFTDRYDRYLRAGDTRWPPFLNWHDQGATWWQWDPAAEFFKTAFRKGDVPLWDNTIAAGVDAHVNVTQGQYFPPYAALLLAGNRPSFRDAYYLGMLLASGACVFLLLRRNALHPIACAAASAAWMLGGGMTLNINSIIGQSIAILPLLLLAMDWCLDSPSPVRAAGLAVAVGLSVLSSFLPVVVAGLTLMAIQLLVYVALAAGRRIARPPHLRVLATGAAGAAAGVVLAAFLLLPMYLASRADVYFSTNYRKTGVQHYPPGTWPALLSRVVPYSVNLGGSPYPPPAGDVGVFDIGLVPVLLALLASGGSPARRRLAAFFVVGGGFMLARLFGVPPPQWLGWLPIFRDVHFIPYGCPAVALPVVGLAALGVENVIRGQVTRLRAAVLTVVVVALLCAGLGFVATHHMSETAGLRDTGFEATRLALLGILVAAIAWMRAAGVIAGRLAGGFLLVAVIVELAPLARVDRFRRAPIWTDLPPYVQMLQADQTRFRFLSTDTLALTANVHQGVGLEGIGSRHAINPWRYSRLIRTYFESLKTVYPIPTGLLPSSRVILDMLNVKYVIAHRPPPKLLDELQAAGLRPHFADGSFAVLRNPTAWPRSYLAGRYRVAPDPGSALKAVGELTGPGEVVLEQQPVASVNAPNAAGAECQIREYAGDRVVVRASTPVPSIVVLTDSYSEGWTATVNGNPAPILAANFAFRAVEVPAGRSEVVFRYVTPGLYAGIALSTATLGGIAGIGLWTLAQRRRSQMLPPGLRSQSGIAP